MTARTRAALVHLRVPIVVVTAAIVVAIYLKYR
jgi:hypothetical protein